MSDVTVTNVVNTVTVNPTVNDVSVTPTSSTVSVSNIITSVTAAAAVVAVTVALAGVQATNDHFNLLNKGTNTHVQIDSHIDDALIHLDLEDVQDAVGDGFLDTTTVDATYDDVNGQYFWNVVQSGIDHGSLSASSLLDDDHPQYILVDGNRDYTGDQNTLALRPVNDETSEIGSLTKRYTRANFQQIMSVAGSGTKTLQAASKGGIMAGIQTGSGTIEHKLDGGLYWATAAIGLVNAGHSAGNAKLEVTKGGAIAMSSVFATGAGGNCITRSDGYASIVFGYSYGQGTSLLQSTNAASFCSAYAHSRRNGSICTVTSGGVGSFLAGFARSHTSTAIAIMEALGDGSATIGWLRQSGAFTGRLRATGRGAVCFGSALGLTQSVLMEATGEGSGAFGSVTDGTLSATAINAFQFGVGTNSTANSLQVGSGSQLYADGRGRFDGVVTTTGRVKAYREVTGATTVTTADERVSFDITVDSLCTLPNPATLTNGTPFDISCAATSTLGKKVTFNYSINGDSSENLIAGENFVIYSNGVEYIT